MCATRNKNKTNDNVWHSQNAFTHVPRSRMVSLKNITTKIADITNGKSAHMTLHAYIPEANWDTQYSTKTCPSFLGWNSAYKKQLHNMLFLYTWEWIRDHKRLVFWSFFLTGSDPFPATGMESRFNNNLSLKNGQMAILGISNLFVILPPLRTPPTMLLSSTMYGSTFILSYHPVPFILQLNKELDTLNKEK